jgi:hypothetical protein
VENELHREYLEALGISHETLRKYKEPNSDKIFKLKKKALNIFKKEIIPFIDKEILRFRKNRKIALTIKGSEQYKRLLESKEYILEGAVI